MYRSLLFGWALFGIAHFGFGQTAFPIQGKIQQTDATPIEAATVHLLRAADSSLVKIELSDGAGAFVFSGVRAGHYQLHVSAVGFGPYRGAPFAVDSTQTTLILPPIILADKGTTLQAVEVTARKPFVERRLDRTVLNLESSILATGSTALDALERAPGVVVGNNDAIAVRGRSGVIVHIDGKPSPLAGADLANFLRALPTDAIERIEIITNPSAKYDAAGNAGIIDIRLKKDKNLGTNGNLSANYGQGVYPKSGAALQLNHRTKKMNAFGGYTYAFRKGMNDLRLYRTFYNGPTRTGAYQQRNYLTAPVHAHGLRAGTDFFPNKKTVLGWVATANGQFVQRNGNNASTVEGPTAQVVESYFGTGSRSRERWLSYTANGNFKRTFGTQGTELNADVDYAQYRSNNQQQFNTGYQDVRGETARPNYLLAGSLVGDLQIRSVKADFSQPLGKQAKWETGVKMSLVNADNNLRFFDESQAGQSVYDSTISNHFLYDERIQAAYANYQRTAEKWSVQAGLRVERTRAQGVQLVDGSAFDRHYTNLFPSFFVQYKASKHYETSLNATRRLDRPTYRQLNPFKNFLDPSTFSAGNAFLNPQYTWSLEWNHTFFQKFNLTAAYAYTTDNITQVIAPVTGRERVTVQTDSNLTAVRYVSLAANYNVDIAPWWSTVNNLNVWHGRYIGNLANTNLNQGNVVAHLFTTHNFKLKKQWAAELSFNYKTKEVYGFMRLRPMWGLGAGVQRQIWHRQGTVKFAITDIFWQNLPSATIRFTDYTEDFEVFRETRVATLSLQYRFGKKEVAQARRRQGGAEEEKRRASSGQG